MDDFDIDKVYIDLIVTQTIQDLVNEIVLKYHVSLTIKTVKIGGLRYGKTFRLNE